MTNPMCLTVLRCPVCANQLSDSANQQLQCSTCSRVFPTADGIPSLALNCTHYYGEIPQPEMRQLLDRVRTSGLETGFRNAMQAVKNPDYFIDYAMRDSRAGWMFLLPLPTRARILDIGCGPGSLSISLARHGHEVFGIDLTLERVQFMMLRAELLGLENIHGIHGGDGARLPFADGTFDLVILNGVLEWLAQGKADANPHDTQLQFLTEAARVLGENGQIYVGIENRYGKDYFLGKLEEHARIPYVSLFPRRIADWYARRRTGQPYRSWTYSSRSLSSLLRDAGFQRRRLLLPVPDYREYHRVLDAESRPTINAYLGESRKKRLVRRIGGGLLIRYLAPSFGMIGGKAPAGCPAWISRLAEHVPALNNSIVEKYLVTETDTVVAQLRAPDKAFVVRLPLNAAAQEACLRNQANIRRLNQPWVPQSVCSGQFEGSQYFVETALPGDPIPASMMRSAMEFLRQLRALPTAASNLHEYVRNITAQLTPFFAEKSILSDLGSYVVDQISTCKIPESVSHGDYWRGNILGSGSRITGLVDWAEAAFGVPSISDALHLITFQRSSTLHITIVEALTPFLTGTMVQTEKQAFDEYMTASGIDLVPALRSAFATLYWLEYLAQRLCRPQNRYSLNPRWLTKHVSESAVLLLKITGLQRRSALIREFQVSRRDSPNSEAISTRVPRAG